MSRSRRRRRRVEEMESDVLTRPRHRPAARGHEHTPTVPRPGATQSPRRRRGVQRPRSEARHTARDIDFANDINCGRAPPPHRRRASPRPRGDDRDVRRGGETRPGEAHAGGTRDGGKELAKLDGGYCSNGEPDRARSRSSRRSLRRRDGIRRSPVRRPRRRATPSFARHRSGSAPRERRRHRLRAGDAAVALDRDAEAHAPSDSLGSTSPASSGTIRSFAASSR